MAQGRSVAHRDIIVCGAGGHAKSVIPAIEAQGTWRVAGLVDDDPARRGTRVLGYEVLGGREQLESLRASGIDKAFVSIGDNLARRAFTAVLESHRFTRVNVVHPSAAVMTKQRIGPGAFIHAFAVIGADSVLGDDAIVSAGACVAHDTVLGDTVHVSPGVLIGGGTRIGSLCFLGMGAAILPGVTLGANVVVGAHSVVNRDVADDVVIVGSPARVIKRLPPP